MTPLQNGVVFHLATDRYSPTHGPAVRGRPLIRGYELRLVIRGYELRLVIRGYELRLASSGNPKIATRLGSPKDRIWRIPWLVTVSTQMP